MKKHKPQKLSRGKTKKECCEKNKVKASAWSYFTGKEFIKQEKPKSLPRIFEQERVEFARLWHNYHQKHAIPYAHDERDEIFNSIVLIFREDKD